MATLGDKDYNKALDFVEAGKLAEAIEAAESALMHEPKEGDYWRLYAALLQQAGRTEDAARAMARGQELGLDGVDALLLKAAEAANAKQWNKAVTACEDALELDPQRAEVWASYATALLEGGYRKDALEASGKAVELEQDIAQLWYLRGRVLRLTGDHNAACEAYQKALELEPTLALAWYEKGMIHDQNEEFEEAKRCFLKAKSLNLAEPGVEQALEILERKLQL
ncbi:MAG: tetratricopeptide repeat protein [Verrucomicrobiota bacterium JB023]|nr:tetratricopeptide repeat protein [Verrucomicrobiota bacterium JB023]